MADPEEQAAMVAWHRARVRYTAAETVARQSAEVLAGRAKELEAAEVALARLVESRTRTPAPASYPAAAAAAAASYPEEPADEQVLAELQAFAQSNGMRVP